MPHRSHAILTVALVTTLILAVGGGISCADDDIPESFAVDPPRAVSFRLADGVRIGGELTSWSAAGCDGSFGGRRWADIMPGDFEKVVIRVMDADRPEHWVTFGAALLRLGRDEKAERAFERAVQIDPEASTLIEKSRAEIAAVREQERARQAAIEAEKLSTRTPEARDWPAAPWPALTPAEQQQAVLAVRAEAERMLTDAGAAPAPIDAVHFIVYSDLDRRDAAILARRLDLMHQRLAALLGLTPGDRLPYGKVAVFIFRDQDHFRLIETQAFDHLPSRDVIAVAHPVGPMVLLNAWRAPGDGAFDAALLHHAVHALMHRHLTPRRLPAWANCGLADFLTATALDDSIVDDRMRPLALQFVRGGGNVNAVLGEGYLGDWWPGPDRLGPAVGHLVVELMTRSNHRGFVSWLNAVKLGKDWEQALQEDFGLSRADLVRLFVQYYRVNQ
jgi:tetratricopeptide (TPR) repeat protein